MDSIPAHWTDAVLPDPFVLQSAGRSIFHYNDLAELRRLFKEATKITIQKKTAECKVNNAALVKRNMPFVK